MKETSFLAKLLDGEKVEWKSLGEVGEIYGGLTGKSKSDFDGGNAKYITYKNIFGNLVVNTDLFQSVKISNSENQHLVKFGDVLFTGSSETADEAGMSSVVMSHFNYPVYLNSFSFGFRFRNDISITPGFSKYLFRSNFIRTEISKTASGVTRFNISKERFRKLQIPIPCPDNPKKSLEIQAEIVRILDNFTTLTAELTAELTARKKQYAYYREQLLTFAEGEVEWKALGEVLIRSKGTQITAGKMRQLHKDGAPIKIFAGGRTIAFVNFDDIPAKDINNKPSIIVKSRGIIAFEYYEKPFSHKNEMWSYYSDNKNIDIKFVYYFLKLNEQHFQNIGSKMQMPQIATPDTDKFKIPIPPLSAQERIVNILDKFDALTNSITEGLPREIELRQQQYEYYRNLLLNFPKNEGVTK